MTHPSRPVRGRADVALCVGYFMVISTRCERGLPALRQIGAGLSELQWTVADTRCVRRCCYRRCAGHRLGSHRFRPAWPFLAPSLVCGCAKCGNADLRAGEARRRAECAGLARAAAGRHIQTMRPGAVPSVWAVSPGLPRARSGAGACCRCRKLAAGLLLNVPIGILGMVLTARHCRLRSPAAGTRPDRPARRILALAGLALV